MSQYKTVDPDLMVHPLRLEMSDEEIGEVLQGVMDDQDWMTLDEINAAMDYLYDYIASNSQTVYGVTTLQ
jgi:hypothetical protein